MSKISRNAPCPCGSGKKYKRCCLGKGQTLFSQEDRLSALDKLEAFVEMELPEEEEEAYDQFYDQWEDRLEELDRQWLEMSQAAYDMWLYLDYQISVASFVVDLFLNQSQQISLGERRYLDLLRNTAMRLYEVVDLAPGKSVTLRDVMDDTRVTVHEQKGSRTMTRYMLLAARLIPVGPSGQPEIEKGLLHLPESMRRQTISDLESYLEEYWCGAPSCSETLFYKEMGPFFHDIWISRVLDPSIPYLANTDGEDMLITSVRFDVIDSAGLEACLDRTQELERAADGQAVWYWNGKNQNGKPISLGRLVHHGDTLEFEGNSVRRGERGRALVEELAAGKVRYQITTHENIRKTILERFPSGQVDDNREPDNGIPRETQEALVLDAKARHYRQWIEDSIPALNGHTPREAAEDSALRPKLIELIHGLEGMYQQELRRGKPAYDPSWMWSELGLEDRSSQPYPPPLAHERMASILPGLGELCQNTAEKRRKQLDFDDRSTILTAEQIRTDLDIRRFLRKNLAKDNLRSDGVALAADSLQTHIEYMTNFELHRRKTFWVDESLSYMLAKTDLEAPGSDLQAPFACFALVFTDRLMLSLAERMLSVDAQCPLAGHFLRVATVYVKQEGQEPNRRLCLWFAFDALGADPPYIETHTIHLEEDSHIQLTIDTPVQQQTVPDLNIQGRRPLRGLLQLMLNAVLYITSPGVEPQAKKSPHRKGQNWNSKPSSAKTPISSENVFFLPGAIEISHVRKLQELERSPGGGKMLHRFMVRGHWRRAAAHWRDQRLRWIAPYWKGPDIAAVIERNYKLKP